MTASKEIYVKNSWKILRKLILKILTLRKFTDNISLFTQNSSKDDDGKTTKTLSLPIASVIHVCL